MRSKNMKRYLILILLLIMVGGCKGKLDFISDSAKGLHGVRGEFEPNITAVGTLVEAYTKVKGITSEPNQCNDTEDELAMCEVMLNECQSQLEEQPEDPPEEVTEDGSKEHPFVDKRARHVGRGGKDGGTYVGQCPGDEKFSRCFSGTTSIPYHAPPEDDKGRDAREGITWWNMSVVSLFDVATCIDREGKYYQWALPSSGVRKFKCK